MRRVAIDLWLDSLFSGGSTNFDINCYTQFCSSSKQWKGGVKSGQTILDLQVGIGWNNHMFISINPFFFEKHFVFEVWTCIVSCQFYGLLASFICRKFWQKTDVLRPSDRFQKNSFFVLLLLATRRGMKSDQAVFHVLLEVPLGLFS